MGIEKLKPGGMLFDLPKFRADLRAHRLKGGKTTYERAGEEIGIGASTVQNIEQGRSKDPSTEIMLRSCRWMGVDPSIYFNL